jgi:Protein of unknown function (DUF2384)
MADDSAEFAKLLSQVQSVIAAAGCADKMDAERWLMTWLDTPNVALGGIAPRCLIKQVEDIASIQ